MATELQKAAARQNLVKARQAKTAQSGGAKASRSPGLSAADEKRLRADQFAFPNERKEPLHDAAHVRNAIARFDQVEGVTDAERDAAWRRIKTAARKFDVDVKADDWRDLFVGGKERKR